VHRDAHGSVAAVIIEVADFAPLNDFLGALPAHPPGSPYSASAVRAIVFTDVCGSVAQTYELGDLGHMRLLTEHDKIVRAELAANDGREVKHTGDGILASFNSISSAVTFGIAVQQALVARNQTEITPLFVSIGISAGEPVTNEQDDLFGATVQLAARLCDAAEPGGIAVSLAVKELCKGKSFTFEDRGHADLKGIPEPTPIFVVRW
jgi:class 3 adenylate cyclase